MRPVFKGHSWPLGDVKPADSSKTGQKRVSFSCFCQKGNSEVPFHLQDQAVTGRKGLSSKINWAKKLSVDWTKDARPTFLTRIVEPIVLGIVLGLLVISIAGLLVSAVGHWALAARI
jgi:hypothetical protein